MQLGNLRAARRTAGPRGKGELVILFTALKVYYTLLLDLTHSGTPLVLNADPFLGAAGQAHRQRQENRPIPTARTSAKKV